ncbi:MAG: single-stranded DNA-binding protein [Bacteroidetes bacterium SW_10_40_5]|nr:MAG: single-stranded DNA-binding protein [Bacteroidetes bacterium SW_10_40_5]
MAYDKNSVNKAILAGHLGKDPEIRYTSANVPVANFSIATNQVYRDKNGENQDTTEWHNIVAWNKLAEVAEKVLKKGRLVYVEGRLQTRQWEDKEGNTRYTTEVRADNMTLLGGGKKDDDQGQPAYQEGRQAASSQGEQASGPPEEESQGDDDLPF